LDVRWLPLIGSPIQFNTLKIIAFTFDFQKKLFIALKKAVNINRFCESAFGASEIKPPIFDTIDLPGFIEHFSNHSRDRRAMICAENH
jgi:hypothetical protein